MASTGEAPTGEGSSSIVYIANVTTGQNPVLHVHVSYEDIVQIYGRDNEDRKEMIRAAKARVDSRPPGGVTIPLNGATELLIRKAVLHNTYGGSRRKRKTLRRRRIA